MKDKRLVDLRFRAESDVRLSKGARWLICRLINEFYLDKHFLPTSEFALPWSKVSELTLVGEDQSYRYLKELRSKAYIRHTGLKLCPPTNHFTFIFFDKKPKDESKAVLAEKLTKAMKRAVTNAETPKKGQFKKGETHPVERPKRKFSWDD